MDWSDFEQKERNEINAMAQEAIASQECKHPYSERVCPSCKWVFCFECCEDTNVHHGGKYQPDYMLCPCCGHDIYQDD
jgi:hypothetical protein